MEKSARNYRPKKGIYDVHGLNDEGIRPENPALLVIELPDSRLLRIMSRSLLLAMFLLALPSLCSIIHASSGNDLSKPELDSTVDNGFDALPLIFRDLLDEGLIEKGQNGLILGAGNGIHDVVEDLGFLTDAGIDLLTRADLHTEKMAAYRVFDFVVITNFQMFQQIDDIVKNDGLVIFPLGNGPSDDPRLLNNYKVMYIRRLGRTVVAMRKMRASDNRAKGVFYEKKGLKDAYLEQPPQKVLGKRSNVSSRKIKSLHSLDNFPDVSTSFDRLYKSRPMRDRYFEAYSMDQERKQETKLFAWLESKLRNQDYVVMNSETQLVEHILKTRLISSGPTVLGMQ